MEIKTEEIISIIGFSIIGFIFAAFKIYELIGRRLRSKYSKPYLDNIKKLKHLLESGWTYETEKSLYGHDLEISNWYFHSKDENNPHTIRLLDDAYERQLLLDKHKRLNVPPLSEFEVEYKSGYLWMPKNGDGYEFGDNGEDENDKQQ